MYKAQRKSGRGSFSAGSSHVDFYKLLSPAASPPVCDGSNRSSWWEGSPPRDLALTANLSAVWLSAQQERDLEDAGKVEHKGEDVMN